MSGVGPITHAAGRDKKPVHALMVRNTLEDGTDIQRGKKIRQARDAKNLTQAKLAQMVGVRPEAIEKYESGQPVTNQETITKLETALDVKL